MKSSSYHGFLAPLLRLVEDSNARAEVIRFVIVGLKSNVVYYLLYVALTSVGVGPKTAVTAVFVFGIVYAFWFSKAFVFRNRQKLSWQFFRYLLVYALLLFLNLVLLDFATLGLGISHLISQPLISLVLTAPLFLLLKFFVFSGSSAGSANAR